MLGAETCWYSDDGSDDPWNLENQGDYKEPAKERS